MSNQKVYEEILSSSFKIGCVIAGPGTGKTTGVLIPKAKQILSNLSINPETVLILSFSRLSAEDLKNKIKDKFKDRVPKASTLHSHCLSFLIDEDNHDIKKRINSILLDFEKNILISDLKEIFPEIKKGLLKKMLTEFSAAWATLPHDEVFSEPDDKKKFKQSVINWLEEHEASILEEIVYFAVDTAKKLKDSEFINQYKYIFVDEYQDLNKLEQEFVSIIAAKSNLLLVVGDPDQSIYSFKFAYPEGIESFSKNVEVKKLNLEYTGRSSKEIVKAANKILLQIDPQRTNLLKPLPNAKDGRVIVEGKIYQEDEFEYVLDSIKKDLERGSLPKEIIILVPKKKLGKVFVDFANFNKQNDSFEFMLSHKIDLKIEEQEKIILFGLIANPNSILHTRTFLGLFDKKNYASEELKILKNKYGSYKNILENTKEKDFSPKYKKMIILCKRIAFLKAFIADNTQKNSNDVDQIINKLFPESDKELAGIRLLLMTLKAESDDVKSLYSKFIDYLRIINSKDNQIRVMTILGSKGLDADIVYIVGCNDGNLPGDNYSSHLDELAHKREQKRLLYVGITRAKSKLVITWSRYIPFDQSRGQNTLTTGTVRKNGKIYSRVGMSEFIQELID